MSTASRVTTTVLPLNGSLQQPSPHLDCDPDDRKWYIFFLSSIFSFLGALVLVLCGKFVSCIYKRQSQRSRGHHKVSDRKSILDRQDDIGCLTSAKDWAGELISGQTNSGRILVCTQYFGMRS